MEGFRIRIASKTLFYFIDLVRNLIVIILGLVVVLAFLLFSNASLVTLYPNKIWRHKVNTTNELGESLGYAGVELDVVFDSDKNYFDIHHPPEAASGLSLELYLDQVPENSELRFWIDFKNLNDSNVELSKNRLMEVFQQTGITHKRVIVEAKSPCLLASFENAGFQTSYYLPSFYNLNEQDLSSTFTITQNTFDSCETRYLSAEYKDYEFLQTQFPDQKKLFWFTAYAGMNKVKARLLLFKLLQDEQVDVLLIKD